MRRRIGDGPSRLGALLDALEEDLLECPADEFHEVMRGTGRARGNACREVRALLDEAAVTGEERAVEAMWPSPPLWTGPLRH